MKKCKECKFYENDLCKNTKNAIIEMANRHEIAVKYRTVKEIKGCKNYDSRV